MLINIITEKELNLIVNLLKGYYNNNDSFSLYEFLIYWISIIYNFTLVILFYLLILRIDEKSNMKYFLYLNGNNNFYYWLGYLFIDLCIILTLMIYILLIDYINEKYSFDLIKIMTFILLGIFIFLK